MKKRAGIRVPTRLIWDYITTKSHEIQGVPLFSSRGIYNCMRNDGRAAYMEDSLLASWQQDFRPAAARDDLAACNKATAAYGLSLTEEQMAGLADRRYEALRATGRVEFGRGALCDIVAAFCDSPYLLQETYEEALAGLQDAFYRYKEEADADGGISDDELVFALRAAFDERAHGAIDAFEDVSLSELRAQVASAQAGEYDEMTQREAAEEESDEGDGERLRDELDRMYDEERLARPGNEFAAGYYDGHGEPYLVGFDASSRIGGSLFW